MKRESGSSEAGEERVKREKKKKGKKRNATCFPDCVLIDTEEVLIKRLRSIQDNQLPFRGMMQKCRKVRNFKKDVDS